MLTCTIKRQSTTLALELPPIRSSQGHRKVPSLPSKDYLLCNLELSSEGSHRKQHFYSLVLGAHRTGLGHKPIFP